MALICRWARGQRLGFACLSDEDGDSLAGEAVEPGEGCYGYAGLVEAEKGGGTGHRGLVPLPVLDISLVLHGSRVSQPNWVSMPVDNGGERVYDMCVAVDTGPRTRGAGSMTNPTIVKHPRSGERYIYEETIIPGGLVYRAAGPLLWRESPDHEEMRDWLDNQGHDAYDTGDWLTKELAQG